MVEGRKKPVTDVRIYNVKTKLIIFIVLLIGGYSLFIFFFFRSHLEKQAIRAIEKKARTGANMIADEISPALLSEDHDAVKDFFEDIKQDYKLVYIAAIDQSGKMYASLDKDNADKAKYIFSTQDSHVSQDKKVYCSITPVVIDGHEIGKLYIGFSFEEIHAYLLKTEMILAMVSFLILLIGITVASLICKSFTKPLTQISQVIDAIARGDLTQRVSVASNDEIGHLAKSFNNMIDIWEVAQQEWGNLNRSLEERVGERTLELQEEINERKKAEEELKLFTAKLEQSNRELQDFAFVASHDLQEPLRKVQAFGERLKVVCGDELSEKGRNYLERMQSAAERMQILIKDLLTFSRVTSKAQPFVEVNLHKVAKEVLSDLETTIERMNAHVELLELPTIEADPLQMRQLLQNLISNGLKFHKKGQTPMVKIYSKAVKKPHRVIMGKAQSKDLCKIVVQDNGIGFDEKYIDRIFAVFQRLHGRSEYEGTGVGLAVCRKIVERHGGTITAESAPGKGAKFIVSIPIKQHHVEKSDGGMKKDLGKRGVKKSREIMEKTVYRGHEPSIIQPVT